MFEKRSHDLTKCSMPLHSHCAMLCFGSLEVGALCSEQSADGGVAASRSWEQLGPKADRYYLCKDFSVCRVHSTPRTAVRLGRPYVLP